LGHRGGEHVVDKGAPLAQRGARARRSRVVLRRDLPAHGVLQDVRTRIRADRRDDFLERCLHGRHVIGARAKSARPVGLLPREQRLASNRRRRHHHDERDLRRPRRCESSHARAFRMAEDTDVPPVDLRSSGQQPHAGQRITGNVLHRRLGGVSRGSSDTAIVVPEDGDAVTRQMIRNRPEDLEPEEFLVAILRAAAGHHHERAEWSFSLRTRQRARQLHGAVRKVTSSLRYGAAVVPSNTAAAGLAACSSTCTLLPVTLIATSGDALCALTSIVPVSSPDGAAKVTEKGSAVPLTSMVPSHRPTSPGASRGGSCEAAARHDATQIVTIATLFQSAGAIGSSSVPPGRGAFNSASARIATGLVRSVRRDHSSSFMIRAQRAPSWNGELPPLERGILHTGAPRPEIVASTCYSHRFRR
jgi:hypothetical protein